MTASSLIVQPSSVSLLTDGAWYDPDGTVRGIRTKVAINHGLRLAIAISGCIMPTTLIAALGEGGTQAEMIERIPSVARSLKAERDDGAPAGWTGDFLLFIAMWSEATDRPEGWVLGTHRAYLGPAYEPFTLAEVEQLWSPPIRRGGFDPRQFDPARDGRAVMMEQRRSIEDGRRWVGGFAEITTVDRRGIHQRKLATWPDVVGEPIRLAA